MSKQENCYWQTMGSVDLGFDFYAPQHFRDEKGRDLIITWLAHGPGCHGSAATMLQKSWVGAAVSRYHVKSVCVRMESW